MSFFFFKQKSAYDMRISDWSSDVCSSDLNHRVEIGKRPEHRVDVAVIGDVIAEIGHGRGIDGRKPDRIHAEIDQMIKPPRDAAQITDTVAIGILTRPGIYLVDATAFPPTLRHASLQIGRASCRERVCQYV